MANGEKLARLKKTLWGDTTFLYILMYRETKESGRRASFTSRPCMVCFSCPTFLIYILCSGTQVVEEADLLSL